MIHIVILPLLLGISNAQSNAQPFGYFVQVTDVHYDSQYTQGTPNNCVLGSTGMGCCRKDSIAVQPWQPANQWGDYNCDIPFALLNASMYWLRDNLDFDFIVYTGDSVDHHDLEQTWQLNMDEIAVVSKMIYVAANGKPVYPVIGNHDTWAIDQLLFDNCTFAPCYNIVLNNIADLWCPLFNFTNAMCNDFRRGGYYETDHFIAWNSLWWDHNNVQTLLCSSYQPMCNFAEQTNWLIDQLNVLNKTGQQKILIAHIPEGAAESVTPFHTFMQNLTYIYQNNIIAQLYGHSHIDEFRLLKDANNQSFAMLYIAPSIVPSQHFPSIRRYKYDVMSYKLLDYEQWTLNLTAQMQNDTFIGYELSYVATQEYGMTDIDAQSWINLVMRFKNNDTLFQTFFKNYNSGKYAYCDASCKHGLLCDIEWVDQYYYDECLSGDNL